MRTVMKVNINQFGETDAAKVTSVFCVLAEYKRAFSFFTK